MPEGASARSILFLAFGAEESGLNGSRYYTENPSIALSQIKAMINMDMVGRLREENRALRQRQDSLASERAALVQKNEQVRNRVEAMIGRLKTMEHSA